MKTKDMTLTALMIALLMICSQLSLPIGPVPITLQTLAILMIGYLLTPRNTLFATSIYLIMGLAGLPVFSGFSGGLQTIFLPSFGFVLAFIPAAFIQASYLRKTQFLKIKHLVLSGLLNLLVTYAIGLPYMAFILNVYMDSQMGVSTILMAGLIPFIPGDLLKLAVGSVMAKRLIPVLSKRVATV